MAFRHFISAALVVAGLDCRAQVNALGRDFPHGPPPAREPGAESAALPTFRKPQIPQSKLPPLEARAVLKPNFAISEAVRARLQSTAPIPRRTGVSIEAFTIQRQALDDLGPLLRADEVMRLEIVRPKTVTPIERAPRNLDALLSHSVRTFESSLHGGQGATMVAAVIDGGSIRRSHVEFQTDRVTLKESNVAESAHATHVAGTMAARGAKAAARGMAPRLRLLSYSFNGDDLAKLARAAPLISVSNHSYGPLTGWAQQRVEGVLHWFWYGDTSISAAEDVEFGRYGTECERLDKLLGDHPHLTAVVAAGNDRDDGPQHQPIEHYVSRWNADTKRFEWAVASDVRKRDGHKQGGYDTLSGLGICKNALSVGAMNDLYQDGAPIQDARVETTYFSSWGPADDGRIKPDVVANGQSLLSATIPSQPSSTPDALYEDMSGTSMASPTAAGIVTVLAEYFQARRGRRPTSAEVRALLAHTATDAGMPGPDAQFGYGSINAMRAGEVINGSGGESIDLIQLAPGEARLITGDGTGPVRVSIAWIDPPGSANVGGLNDSSPALVNDVDLDVVSPAGTVYFPYRLDAARPSSAARADAPNRVDNLEVVDAPAQAGAWTVRVKAPLTLAAPSQQVAVVIQGLKAP